MNKHLILLFGAAALIGCSDSGNSKMDAGKTDAPLEDVPFRDAPIVPTPPAIGAQIDRMGRPAINTALNAVLNPVAADVTTMKDNYNHATDPATWASTVLLASGNKTVESEFMANLAVLDVLDQGAAGITAAGCGNQVLYNGMPGGGGTPGANSYKALADVLADDELFVDTAKGTCLQYLSLEAEVATGGAVTHTQCGGRAPSNDVVDISYSLLAAGLAGFSTDGKFTPLISDGGGATKVTVHGDVSDLSFPYLGPPTNP